MDASPLIAPHYRALMGTLGSLPGAASHAQGDVAWVTSAIGWPLFNGGTGTDSAGVAAALDALRRHGRPYFWWIAGRPTAGLATALTEAGAEAFDVDAPWEEARIADLPPAPTPDPGVRIEEVRGEAAHRTWAATLRRVFGFPAAGEDGWLAPAERCGWDGLPWRQWAAFDGDQPVGVTMMVEAGGVAELIGVGVLPQARRRGIGRALTLVALHAADAAVAGFPSTPDGSALYHSLGFAPRGTVTRWLWRPTA